MLERDISRSDVKKVLLDGIIIEEYTKDQSFPSFLLLGFIENENPLHVLAVLNKKPDGVILLQHAVRMHGHFFHSVHEDAWFTDFHMELFIRSEKMRYSSLPLSTSTENQTIGRIE